MAKSEEFREDMISSLAAETNKVLKKKKLDVQTYIFAEDAETQADVKYFVHTGSHKLDIAISNRKHGGFPSGRITEISGLESTGKSLIAAHALTSAQRAGGVAVYIDIESALSREFLTAIGIDLKKLIYVPVSKIEDAFETMEYLIGAIREKNSKCPVVIVLDSIAAATTRVEEESDYGKDGFATTKALVNSKAMRKLTNLIAKQDITAIFVNQLREKLSAMFGDKYTTSGGRAIGFHSSVRIKLSRLSKIKGKSELGDVIIGIKTQAEITKNRIGPPFRKCTFDVYFDRGIDDYPGWLEDLKTLKLFDNDRTPYKITVPADDDHEEQQYTIPKESASEVFEAEPRLREYCYNAIAESVITQYKNRDFKEIYFEEDKELPDEETENTKEESE